MACGARVEGLWAPQSLVSQAAVGFRGASTRRARLHGGWTAASTSWRETQRAMDEGLLDALISVAI